MNVTEGSRRATGSIPTTMDGRELVVAGIIVVATAVMLAANGFRHYGLDRAATVGLAVPVVPRWHEAWPR